MLQQQNYSKEINKTKLNEYLVKTKKLLFGNIINYELVQ
jgi:hypothetical protein